MKDQKTLCCSFCSTPSTDVEMLFASHENSFICNVCIDLCIEIIAVKRAANKEYESWFI